MGGRTDGYDAVQTAKDAFLARGGGAGWIRGVRRSPTPLRYWSELWSRERAPPLQKFEWERVDAAELPEVARRAWTKPFRAAKDARLA